MTQQPELTPAQNAALEFYLLDYAESEDGSGEWFAYCDGDPANGYPGSSCECIEDVERWYAAALEQIKKWHAEDASSDIARGICPSCTWRGDVELVDGVCPRCKTDWAALEGAGA